VLDQNVGLLSLDANIALEQPIAFPVLENVGGSLTIASNPSLTTIAMPALASIGASLEISGNTSLTTIAMPALASIGTSLEISGNTSLTSVEVPSLHQMGGDPIGDDFTVSRNSTFFGCAAIDALVDSVYGPEPGSSPCPDAAELVLRDAGGGGCIAVTCE
jgi:hypothetical protein